MIILGGCAGVVSGRAATPRTISVDLCGLPRKKKKGENGRGLPWLPTLSVHLLKHRIVPRV